MILVLEDNITQEQQNSILSILREGGCLVRQMSMCNRDHRQRWTQR
jgi:hypothetical protein